LRSAWLLAVVAIAAVGCAARRAPPPATGHVRRGYALLHELLGNEKDVSKLLLVKDVPKPVKQTIDAISDVAGKGKDRLEELAGAPPPIDLDDTGLPADEQRAREAIADLRKHRLLAATGRALEVELLVSQNEALVYAIGLTETLARSEPNAERLAFVRALHEDVARLQRDVLGLLRPR